MFSEDEIKEIFEARLRGEIHFYEREAYDLPTNVLLALEKLADYDSFDKLNEDLLIELL